MSQLPSNTNGIQTIGYILIWEKKSPKDVPSLPLSSAYVDDISAMVHHKDVKFFLTELDKLVKARGCFINPQKTHILTSCNHHSILPQLSSTHHQRSHNRSKTAYTNTPTPLIKPQEKSSTKKSWTASAYLAHQLDRKNLHTHSTPTNSNQYKNNANCRQTHPVKNI